MNYEQSSVFEQLTTQNSYSFIFNFFLFEKEVSIVTRLWSCEVLLLEEF